jgi:hypothetical protein
MPLFGRIHGNQVDAWAALIVGKTKMQTAIENKLIEKIEAKGLLRLEIGFEGIRFDDSLFIGGALRALRHIVFRQRLGDGAIVTVAVRVEQQGTHDLGVSWRLMERNKLTEFLQNLPAYFLIVVSLFFCSLLFSSDGENRFFGVLCGFPLFFWGLVLWSSAVQKRKIEGSTSTHQKVATRMLLVAVDHALMEVLEELEVEPEDIKIIRSAQSEGVGKLFAPS